MVLMSIARWLWSQANYWPIWLVAVVGSFLLRELWARAAAVHRTPYQIGYGYILRLYHVRASHNGRPPTCSYSAPIL